MKHMNRKKRRKMEFIDLLIPLLIVLAILPFVVYLAMYDCGLGQELWYGENDIIGDIYCYYKSRLFVLVSVVAALILCVSFLIYKNYRHLPKMFWLLAIFYVPVLISTFRTVNTKDTTIGSIYHFESIFVLLGYGIMFLYAYVIVRKEKDYECIAQTLLISTAGLAVIGLLQVCNKDLFDMEWFIRLITPAEWETYALENMQDAFSGNNVSLTLFNPNNAGQYLAMILPVFILWALFTEKKWMKCVLGFFSVILILLLWCTYSRGALLAFFVELLVLSVILWKKHSLKSRKSFTYIVFFAGLCVIILLFVEFMSGFKFIHRLHDESSDSKLKEIVTGSDSVDITYDNHKVQIGFSDQASGFFVQLDGDDVTDTYLAADGSFQREELKNFQVFSMEENSEPVMVVMIEDIGYSFIYEDESYYHINDLGKADKLVHIEALDFHGMELKGSGRLYIWSRSIPLLKNYLIWGSGPDTFYRVFPQNDYVGKKQYTGTSARMIEKPHNNYIKIAVQTGVLSLVLLIIFYGWYASCIAKAISDTQVFSKKNIVGIGFFLGTIGYVISSFFYDSSLPCTPLAALMAGVSLAYARKESN